MSTASSKNSTQEPDNIIYFLSQLDDQSAQVLNTLALGKSCRLILPKDGDHYHRLIPLINSLLVVDKQVLIIAPTPHHLSAIEEALESVNLNGLTFTIQGGASMIKELHTKLNEEQKSQIFPQQEWNTLQKQAKRLNQLLQTQFCQLMDTVFGGHNRQNLIAAYISARQVADKTWLTGLIPASDLQFDMDTFSRMRKEIEVAEKQYNGQLEHPLAQLHPNHYQDSPKETLGHLQTQISHFLESANQLRRQFLKRIDQYQNSLQYYYDQHYLDCSKLLREIIHNIEDFEFDTNIKLAEAGGLAPRKSLFGLGTKTQSVNGREEIINLYQQLRSIHQQVGEVEFELPSTQSLYQPTPLLNEYQAALIDWHQSVPQIIREQLIRLNQRTAHPATDLGIHIKELEEDLLDFIQLLNKETLFNEEIHNNSLTILQQQSLLDEIISKLNAIRDVLPEFLDFRIWQTHWLAAQETSRKIILQLVKTGAKDWVSIFESWFWYQTLAKLSARDLPRNNQSILNLIQHSKRLNQLVPSYIKSKQKSIWPKPKEITQQLRLINQDEKATCIEQAKPYFPILLSTEDQLDELITSEFQTDVLISLDSHFISEKTIRPLAFQHLLVSDISPEQFNGQTNLWKTPGLGSIQQHRLNVTTGATAPSLRFYLASQYGNYEQAPGQAQQILIYQVMGRVNESDQGNEAEARQIVKYLHQLQQLEDGVAPEGLSILCATTGQSKRILHYIQESIRRNVVGASWLERLLEKGLKIYSFSEIKGQQTKRVIISLVTDGQNENALGWLTSSSNPANLLALLSLATEQIVLFHSIQEDARSEWENSQSSNLQLFAKWLAYTRAVAKSIGSQQKHILSDIAQKRTKVKLEIPLIYRAIAQALLAYFPADRIKINHHIGQIYFPLMIWPETTNETGVLIIIDQVISQNSAYPWLAANRLSNTATQHGFKVVETWSVLWWQDPEQAARQLAGRVMRSV